MPATNTPHSYGTVARSLHWLTALLIFTAFPLGMIAENLPFDSSEALARKAQLFSVHKTLGVTVFCVALVRIVWALVQPHPAALHPERRAETFAAMLVHWSLYLSLVLVPLSGWVHHAAVEGFAPILWPFGQGLPFVPKSETLAALAATVHVVLTKVLLVSVLLHIAGALKHALFDRDAVLARMTRGTPAAPRAGSPAPRHRAPLALAMAVYAASLGLAWSMATPDAESGASVPGAETSAAAHAAAGGNWTVESGSLGMAVRQMGASVEGQFPGWTAAITFAETPVEGRNGHVTVTIDTTRLTLGSVSEQARGADFFDTAAFPAAVFDADILPAATGYEARGTLTLRGVEKPLSLPFTLQINGDTATMQGETTLDRRDFGMGAAYPDESSVGFAVTVKVTLTARRGG